MDKTEAWTDGIYKNVAKIRFKFYHLYIEISDKLLQVQLRWNTMESIFLTTLYLFFWLCKKIQITKLGAIFEIVAIMAATYEPLKIFKTN